ncbi:tRNA 2-thiouridine(34) synthase MnmA [Candidatus Adlerbacteria bacterium RIFCSPHIGHO2_12_FULL_53_18]|uniref:tRNA-specific 2-thiouridylase MnmA n=1 Tax=Candidatus Adlerbacteria bacterium RIFCSPHIGHO2_12_FULL_53_18 TaxID=1797242 RepID=A0A1F4XTW1_9BACT|nr:MAG: tRNA 2-thiouridine(34) synthase MnmA [Candidatus Adlerbacteria bacterium RIFCSPHIGHO2_12_FULL_53_18]
MKNRKVFVGLSGGVDSAVSAALLKHEGYDVTGVFITIALPGYPCPAAEDRVEAMRVAAHLDIPFLEVNLSKEYEQEVFRPSIEEWQRGRTPNPDTLCNEKIKFGIFFDWCVEKGADFVATGHYARFSYHLKTAVDSEKDQTYFLWAVSEKKLQKTLFPVGGMQKSEVRALAKKFGLPVALRKDSQGLCFLGPISLEDMIEHEVPQTRGDVLSKSGEVIGTHKGVAHYTLGQRHGFDLQSTKAHTSPHFVIAKDIQANTITVSTSRVPRGKTNTIVTLKEINFIGEVSDGLCMARYRYRQTLIPAMLMNGTKVVLDEPHFVPEGQSLVLYRGDRCLGGGVVESATLT